MAKSQRLKGGGGKLGGGESSFAVLQSIDNLVPSNPTISLNWNLLVHVYILAICMYIYLKHILIKGRGCVFFKVKLQFEISS